MDPDRDEKRIVLSLKREKVVHARPYTQNLGKAWEGKGVEGKEAIVYAQPHPEEEEGWTDLGWIGWPGGVGRFGGMGGVSFNGGGLPFSNVGYVTEASQPSQALQATVCPVPEPSVPVMLFTGVVSLAAIQWLRRRAR